jgi:cobalt-zinc-cadmium resistance protein CzcA
MITELIRYSLQNRGFVCLILLALVGSGAYALLHLPVDALPDLTNVQVMALTDAPALGPEEIERFITIPVENAMNGIPRIKEIRSYSQAGVSGVTIIFEDATDVYWARQQVSERLAQVQASIPEGFGNPQMGPIASGLGEIYQFEVRNAPGSRQPRSLMELRTILDWDVARPLKSVPGVIEVNALGGELKSYEVRLDPNQLLARGISVDQVFEAVRHNNANAGGGFIQHHGELRVIRGVGLVGNLKDLEEIVLQTTADGTPIHIRDVAEVCFAPMLRHGAATRDGRGEAVTAIAYLLAGENSRVVVGRIEAKIREIQKQLPDGVVIDPYYDRADLIEKTILGVAGNLAEGSVLVVAVLLIVLGNLKAGLIVALAIPLSMLFAGNLMFSQGVAGNLMSLGAVNFGLIVVAAAIVIENCVGRLADAPQGVASAGVVLRATKEVRKPVVFGAAIIAFVHLPILALRGIEGKMFEPMALTAIFAVTGSLLLALTATPVLASFVLKSEIVEYETWPVRAAKRLYQPVLAAALGHPGAVVLGALLACAASLLIASRIGGEFIPQLGEGDLVIAAVRPPSASLDEGIADATRLERALQKALPDEIRAVVSRIGRPEIGVEAAGVNMTDHWIMFHEPDQWKQVASRAELRRRVDEICRREIPGTYYSFSQPIELRFKEMLAGLSADVGLGVYGDDLGVLQEKVNALAEVLSSIPGASEVRSEALGGLPVLRINVDRERIDRHGINAADVLDVVTALGGKVVGEVVEGARRFALQVRFAPQYRDDLDTIRQLKIADPQGRMIPLEDLAELVLEDGVFEIWRKNRQRQAIIQANVRGRDLASFVAEAKQRVAAEVALPRGYSLEWVGTFADLEAAGQRMMAVVPAALGLIFLLLYASFNSTRLAAFIFLSVPLCAVGGVFALWLRGLSFSVPAAIGFITLSGVAVLDSLVLVAAIQHMLELGIELPAAVFGASLARFRAILMIGLVGSFGFVPMATGRAVGVEVHRPLATVVIGGLLTGMLIKLVVLPAIYPWFDPGSKILIRDDDSTSDQIGELTPE